jgi:hypothetical protein
MKFKQHVQALVLTVILIAALVIPAFAVSKFTQPSPVKIASRAFISDK